MMKNTTGVRLLGQDQDTRRGRRRAQPGTAETGREEGEEEVGYCPAAYPDLGHHEDALREPNLGQLTAKGHTPYPLDSSTSPSSTANGPPARRRWESRSDL